MIPGGKKGTLIVFVKAPAAGRVKTRLAREVGAGRAAALFRHLMETTFAAARGPWRTILAVDPASAMAGRRALWPADFELMAQGGGDLGARMARAMAAVPRGPVAVIGADAPALRTRHIRAAFAALARHDAVVGPAMDGGYWLIGLARRARAPRLFEGVRWSGPHALDDTLKTLPEGFSLARLETLADIDEAADLPALIARSKARQR